MQKGDITALYERLSFDDELQAESNSISNHLLKQIKTKFLYLLAS